jgi:hypothetical protein
MHEHDRKYIKEFFKAIEPNLPGYQHINFNYVALKNGSGFDLLKGRLHLQGVPALSKPHFFQSANIRAGIYLLSELNLTAQGFVDTLLAGKIKTPHGDLLFEVADGRSYSAYFDSHHQDGLASQRRQIYLNINGGRRQRLELTSLDW